MMQRMAFMKDRCSFLEILRFLGEDMDFGLRRICIDEDDLFYVAWDVGV